MFLEKVVDETRPYVSKKDGKTRPSVTYYLVADVATDGDVQAREVRFAILPKFVDSQRDWYHMEMLARVRRISVEGK